MGVLLAIAPNGNGYPVDGVFAGTDAAAKGVAAGDLIVAIDGQPLSSLGAVEAAMLLSGTVGSTKMMEFGVTASVALSGQTVAIRVDELLPP